MHRNAWKFLVGGLEMFEFGRNMQCILYDEETMKCFGGYISGITMGGIQELDLSPLESNHRIIKGISNVTADVTAKLEEEIIKLDPTTMKRIARFNLEKENEKLLKEIDEQKKRIENLKTKYDELNARLQIISDIGTDIWENGAEYKKEYDEYD